MRHAAERGCRARPEGVADYRSDSLQATAWRSAWRPCTAWRARRRARFQFRQSSSPRQPELFHIGAHPLERGGNHDREQQDQQSGQRPEAAALLRRLVANGPVRREQDRQHEGARGDQLEEPPTRVLGVGQARGALDQVGPAEEVAELDDHEDEEQRVEQTEGSADRDNAEGKAPAWAAPAAAKPACTYSHAWRPRMATPRRLRQARQQRIASPIKSSARSATESRAMKFDANSRMATASQRASALTAMPWRCTMYPPPATRPAAQSSAFRPPGVARSRRSPETPSTVAAPRISRPRVGVSLMAVIPPQSPAARRSGAAACGIRRSPRRDPRRRNPASSGR